MDYHLTMATKNQQFRRARPVNLNLFRFHFPLSAVTSITHRLTGGLLFLGVWLLLYLLHLALQDDASAQLSAILASIWGKGALMLLGACAIFHLLAGIKHLLMDLHIGESLQVAQGLSCSTWLITVLLTAFLIAALWR